MAIVDRPNEFSAGATEIAAQVNADLDTLYSEINGNLNSANLKDGAVTDAKMDVSVRQSISRDETGVGNFVPSGLTSSTSVSLVLTMAAGTAYVKGYRIVFAQQQFTVTASKDTYFDLNSSGNMVTQAVGNGAAAPSLTANSIRIGKAVSSGSAITTWTDLRNTTPAASSGIATVEPMSINGCEVEYFSATQIKVLPGVFESGGERYENTGSTVVTVTGNTNWITGSAAASTHVYVYGLGDANFNFTVAVSSTAPSYHDTDGNQNGTKHFLKNGTNYYRFLGYCRLDASVLTKFRSIVSPGHVDVTFDDVGRTVVASTTTTTWTAQSLSSHIPANAFQAKVSNANLTNAYSTTFFRATGIAVTTGIPISMGGPPGVAEQAFGRGTVNTSASQSIDYRGSTADAVKLRVTGFTFQR